VKNSRDRGEGTLAKGSTTVSMASLISRRKWAYWFLGGMRTGATKRSLSSSGPL
jgi:hypothetical protein